MNYLTRKELSAAPTRTGKSLEFLKEHLKPSSTAIFIAHGDDHLGIALLPGHLVRVERSNEPTQTFKIVSAFEFRDEDGAKYGQQDVFGRTYNRVDVIDPVTKKVTQY